MYLTMTQASCHSVSSPPMTDYNYRTQQLESGMQVYHLFLCFFFVSLYLLTLYVFIFSSPLPSLTMLSRTREHRKGTRGPRSGVARRRRRESEQRCAARRRASRGVPASRAAAHRCVVRDVHRGSAQSR